MTVTATPDRLIELEAVCTRLCNAFAYHLDHGEFDALAALFAPDGVFDRNGTRLEGRAAILDAYAKRPQATTVHLMMNFHLIEAGETELRGSVNSLVLHAMGVSDEVLKFDPMGAMRVLEFEDRYVLTDDGWRFSYRGPRPILESSSWPGI